MSDVPAPVPAFPRERDDHAHGSGHVHLEQLAAPEEDDVPRWFCPKCRLYANKKFKIRHQCTYCSQKFEGNDNEDEILVQLKAHCERRFHFGPHFVPELAAVRNKTVDEVVSLSVFYGAKGDAALGEDVPSSEDDEVIVVFDLSDADEDDQITGFIDESESESAAAETVDVVGAGNDGMCPISSAADGAGASAAAISLSSNAAAPSVTSPLVAEEINADNSSDIADERSKRGTSAATDGRATKRHRKGAETLFDEAGYPLGGAKYEGMLAASDLENWQKSALSNKRLRYVTLHDLGSVPFRVFSCACAAGFERKLAMGSASNALKHAVPKFCSLIKIDHDLANGKSDIASDVRNGAKINKMTASERAAAARRSHPKKKLTQVRLNKYIIRLFIVTNLPNSTLRVPEFIELLKVIGGVRMEGMTIMSPATLVRERRLAATSARLALKEDLKGSHGDISISMDIWTCARSTSYLCVTGHWYGDSIKLRSSLLEMCSLGKCTDEGESRKLTAEVIATEVVKMLSFLFDDFVETAEDGYLGGKVFTCVTDGGSNMKAAALLLVGVRGARRCFQHSVELTLKWFSMGAVSLADALSVGNSVAKLSKSSNAFSDFLGNYSGGKKKVIAASVATRWSSQISCARDLIQFEKAISDYSSIRRRSNDMPPSLQTASSFLFDVNSSHGSGMEVLKDFEFLMGPLSDLTISLEGEFYPTSSPVIAELTKVKAAIDDEFARSAATVAAEPREAGDLFRTADRYVKWKDIFDKLWKRYLSAFFDDEYCLVSTLLDVRYGYSALTDISLEKALDAVDKLAMEQAQRDNPVAAQPVVLADRAQRVLAGHFGDVPVAAAHGQAVKDALHSELATLMAIPVPDEKHYNPMQVFSPDASVRPIGVPYLPMLAKLARRLLAMPAGEAPSERIFSIAARVLGKIRLKSQDDC